MKIPARLRRLAGVGSRFLVVGAISTVVEIAAFNLFVFMLGWDPVVSKVVASLVALINAYIGNREWAFRHRDRRGRFSEIVLFLVTNGVCTLLGAGLVWLGVEALELIVGHATGAFALNVVNLISIVIVVVFRFVLYHKVVFRSASGS
ncbi:GtrA family protein [Microbacterium aerolatum]|uniref:GtrA family protein n=1 Tax=Microbacterium aerolatum TaxID=153731 RepID=UPI002000A6FD|nr:GtrA family protein [Microbacterium aerolatum]MCK3769968.1 GtrA family protein [Microbacterium aerolatum]